MPLRSFISWGLVHDSCQINYLLWSCVRYDQCGFCLNVFISLHLVGREHWTAGRNHNVFGPMMECQQKALFPSKNYERGPSCPGSLNELLRRQRCMPMHTELMEHSPYTSLIWITIALQRIQHMAGNKQMLLMFSPVLEVDWLTAGGCFPSLHSAPVRTAPSSSCILRWSIMVDYYAGWTTTMMPEEQWTSQTNQSHLPVSLSTVSGIYCFPASISFLHLFTHPVKQYSLFCQALQCAVCLSVRLSVRKLAFTSHQQPEYGRLYIMEVIGQLVNTWITYCMVAKIAGWICPGGCWLCDLLLAGMVYQLHSPDHKFASAPA